MNSNKNIEIMYCLFNYIEFIQQYDEENLKIKKIVYECIYSEYFTKISKEEYDLLLDNFDINIFIKFIVNKLNIDIDINLKIFLGLKSKDYI